LCATLVPIHFQSLEILVEELTIITDMDFAENDVVLCYHGPLLYEAKVRLNVWGEFRRCFAETVHQVIQTKRFDEHPPSSQYGPHYFVHYKGWKNTWDGAPVTTNTHMFKTLILSTEWVHQSRLLKRDETNLALQKKLQQTHRAAIGKEKDPTSHKAREKDPNKDREKEKDREPKFPKKELRIKQSKLKEEDVDETDYQPPPKKKQELKLSVPETLKVFLVDDWEAVTRHGQLVSLPRSPCVDDILLEFKEYVLELPEADAPSDVEEKLPSVLIGFKQYFDACVYQTPVPGRQITHQTPFPVPLVLTYFTALSELNTQTSGAD
jgi:mortality factor 4-like protein 1